MEQPELNVCHQLHKSNSSTTAEQVDSFHQELQDSVTEDDVKDSYDSMVCDFGGRLIRSGFRRSDYTEEYVMFINAGGEALSAEDSDIVITSDNFYEGGNVLRTNEQIAEAGSYQSLYQSARLGNFGYKFSSLPPGDYNVDLHFAEIINTNGPKGIRVFNVYIQEEKVLSDFDIFEVVGANQPLQLIDSRVSVKDDGLLLIRFESVHGSAVVCGICVRKASKFRSVAQDFITCNICAAPIEVPLAQKKHMQAKTTAKYEKKIEELKTQCQLKTKECHEAWMSLTATNEQLDMSRMELDNLTFKTLTLDQTMEKQAENLRSLSSRYEHDKNRWGEAIDDLQGKIKLMKRKHCQLSSEAHECIDTIPDLSKMVSAVQALVLQCEDLKKKYSEEMAKRRKLFNEVQEAKGNIRVFCRCRPLSKREIGAGCTDVVDFDTAKDGCLGILTGGSTKKTFRFDRVYSPRDDQVDVFADASPMVVSVLDGYNVCIFAYGQTGTGKTFTMEGTEKNRGVNYRTLEQLFETSKERSEAYKYDISVSVLEVYNEQIRDLLSTEPTKKLDIKQAPEGFHHIPGITEAKVENIKEVWNVLQTGSNARSVGSNNVNEHSSRSHCMLCISVKAKNLMTGDCTKSKLWLVDLAGSERLAKTDVQGERLKEAQNINRSLSALGDVISALANKSSHIPYRNSKLTHLLQDSLGGDAKTLMFVQISPSDQDLGETLSSLNFAARVRGVELGPVRKQPDNGEIQKIKTMLEKARYECKTKDESLKKLEESLQNQENKFKSKDLIQRSMQEKIKELEDQIELKKALHNQSERQISQLSDQLKGKEETCNNLQQKMKELENKLREQHQSNAAASQEKIKDLEHRLKEQLHESESQSAFLQNKIKELERKLKDQERNSELLLQQKIKELEEKFREPQQEQLADDMFDAAARTTPYEGKSCIKDEAVSEIESHILRSSNSVNRLSSQSTKSVKGKDYVPQVRSKRIHEVENRRVSSAYESRVTRKSDPPRVAITRPTRPVISTAARQAPLSHKRTSRDQVQGVRERDSKKIWSR